MISGGRIDLKKLLSGGAGNIDMPGIAKRVLNGAVFVYPTETIYGIGGRVDESVKNRIINIKKRPPDNPMLVLGGKQSDFDMLGLEFNPDAQRLIKKFWPGSVSLILKKRGENGTLAVRISDHPFLRSLFSHIDMPIYSTSANISGKDYTGDTDSIYETFRDDIDFMIEAGELPASRPSTIVDVSGEGRAAVIREGAVSEKDVINCIA